jgi:hypothetical protein
MLDAVLPLILNDYKRFCMLDASLRKFFPDLRMLFIIVPDRELDTLRTKIKHDLYKVIPESALVPEFRLFLHLSGWQKQQLIKLSAAEIVETDFYLTLDSDILFVRSARSCDFVKAGRSCCFKHKLEKSAEIFVQWYRDAERVLKIERAEYHHDVTPAILSKEAVLRLHEYLRGIARDVTISFRRRDLLYWGAMILLKLMPRVSFAEWRLYLLRSVLWTEYSLYYTFLEAHNLFEKYHYVLDHRISGNSVWYIEDYASWDPENSFVGDRNFYFSVIQSNISIDPDEIWKRVRPYLQQD